MAIIHDESDERLPGPAREALGFLVVQLTGVKEQLALLEKQLNQWHKNSEASQRLASIPGVGVITATALVASIGDATQFRSGRELAAWLGLVPKQNSSGNKQRLRFRWIPVTVTETIPPCITTPPIGWGAGFR